MFMYSSYSLNHYQGYHYLVTVFFFKFHCCCLNVYNANSHLMLCLKGLHQHADAAIDREVESTERY